MFVLFGPNPFRVSSIFSLLSSKINEAKFLINILVQGKSEPPRANSFVLCLLTCGLVHSIYYNIPFLIIGLSVAIIYNLREQKVRGEANAKRRHLGFARLDSPAPGKTLFCILVHREPSYDYSPQISATTGPSNRTKE